MSRDFNVTIVGYGLAGRIFHRPLVLATPGLRLACVVARDPAKVHADLPEMPVVSDLAAVLRDPAIDLPEVDLVVIATPDHCHAEHALAALAAGKHVVVDKPLAPTLAEARAIVAAAQQHGRMLAVFHNRRWDADFLTLRGLIEAGELGEIVQFESHFDRYRPEVQHRWKDARDAGIWQDLGPHLIDQALVLFGRPLAVFADFACQRAGAGAPDYVHALLRYPQLRVILHASQSTQASGLRYAVHGARGSFIKHGLDPQEAQSVAGMRPGYAAWGVDDAPGTLTRDDAQGGVSEALVHSQRGDYPAFYVAMREAMAGRGPVPVSGAEALAVMEVLEAGVLSARERREVAL